MARPSITREGSKNRHFIWRGGLHRLAGFQLGASLGGTFSGGNKNVRLPSQEGPRLSYLRIQTSTYGKLIPEIYGSMRLVGNVIWAQPIKEVQLAATEWLWTYNNQRPNMAIGGLTPKQKLQNNLSFG